MYQWGARHSIAKSIGRDEMSKGQIVLSVIDVKTSRRTDIAVPFKPDYHIVRPDVCIDDLKEIGLRKPEHQAQCRYVLRVEQPWEWEQDEDESKESDDSGRAQRRHASRGK